MINPQEEQWQAMRSRFGVTSDTDWAWDLDAVVAAIAATWPQASIHDGYPIQGSIFRAYLDLPDPPDSRGIQVAFNDLGKLISFDTAGLLPLSDGRSCDPNHCNPTISRPQRPLTSSDGIS